MQKPTPTEIELTDAELKGLDAYASLTGITRDQAIRRAAQTLLAREGLGVFLTRKQVARVLRVSLPTVAQLMKRKKNPLPAVRLSARKIIFYEPEVRLWAKTL